MQHDPLQGPARSCQPRSLAQATGTYRLQLRNGLDFAAALDWLPYLSELGVSHLYLSPIFTAHEGSTHGYDVTRPGEVDPTLGGRDGFERLARAARERGIGIILDIVPNHTALTFDNPWLRDVLRHGKASHYARHFDIDWGQGPLRLAMLGAPLPKVLSEAAPELAEDADGAVLRVAGLSVPLNPKTVAGRKAGTLDAAAALDLAAGQAWRLVPWQTERDTITHRRFFNVTSLIGMRVEDQTVFDDMHRLIFELCDAGLVQGLRIDHIDGLTDPEDYLAKLHGRLPETPLWVEKILSGDEALDIAWPVCGTTGYEAARAIAGVLGNAVGVVELCRTWSARTGRDGSFHDALMAAKPVVLVNELAAELHQLVGLAASAIEEAGEIGTGPEALREALTALLVAMPRYRTYFSDRVPRDEDRAIWARVAKDAAKGPRDDTVLHHLAQLIEAGEGAAAARLRTRFQQVSGALIAKSLEDTAGFRHTPYLAANEVGAEPDEPVLSAEGFAAFCRTQALLWPDALLLTSSHDTKRSEDARMRLVAIGHLPEVFTAIFDDIAARPEAAGIDAGTLWYLAQSAVAVWQPGPGGDLGDRLASHMEKAMREAKEVTYWTRPVPEVEAPVTALARALMQDWAVEAPAGLAEIVRRGSTLSLCQTALKLVMPGLPDIYRGTEEGRFELTDPDNRRRVSPERLTELLHGDDPAGAKAQLIRDLFRLRRREPGLFVGTEFRAHRDGDTLRVERVAPDGTTLALTLDTEATPDKAVTYHTEAPEG